MRQVLLLALLGLTGPVLLPDDPLVVGWSDEFNSSHNWKSFPPPNAPDVSTPHKGAVRLRIGKQGMDRSIPFFWASAWRIAEIDVKRYPILAVSTHDLRGPGWWDVIVQRWENGRLIGKEVKSPSLDHGGVLLFDLAGASAKDLELSKPSDRQGPISLRVRINIAGTKEGCSIDYYWLRFISREDEDRVRKNPNINSLVLAP